LVHLVSGVVTAFQIFWAGDIRRFGGSTGRREAGQGVLRSHVHVTDRSLEVYDDLPRRSATLTRIAANANIGWLWS